MSASPFLSLYETSGALFFASWFMRNPGMDEVSFWF
jgi:hypothetical protein